VDSGRAAARTEVSVGEETVEAGKEGSGGLLISEEGTEGSFFWGVALL